MFYIPSERQVVEDLNILKNIELSQEAILSTYSFAERYPGWKSTYFQHPDVLEVTNSLGLKVSVNYSSSGICAKTIRAIDVSQPTEARKALEKSYYLVDGNFYNSDETKELVFSAMGELDVERIATEMTEIAKKLAVESELKIFRNRYKDIFLQSKFSSEADEDGDTDLWLAVKQTLEACISYHCPPELGGNERLDPALVVEAFRKNEPKAFQTFQDLVVAATNRTFEEVLEEGRAAYKKDPFAALEYSQRIAKVTCQYAEANGLVD